MRHHASWHKTCHLKFNPPQLDRLAREKRRVRIADARDVETAQEEGVNFGRRPCSYLGRPDYKEEIFFYCDEPGGTAGLNCACTHEISKVCK